MLALLQIFFREYVCERIFLNRSIFDEDMVKNTVSTFSDSRALVFLFILDFDVIK